MSHDNPHVVVALVPAIVALIGLVVYLLAEKPKVAELGRIFLFVGVFWLVFVMARLTVAL